MSVSKKLQDVVEGMTETEKFDALVGCVEQGLNWMAQQVHKNAKAKGFYDKTVSISTQCVNLHGEVSELWESFRAGTLDDRSVKTVKLNGEDCQLPLTNFEEELADIVIRALDMAADRQIDIGKAVVLKHAFNTQRSRLHGGKKA